LNDALRIIQTLQSELESREAERARLEQSGISYQSQLQDRDNHIRTLNDRLRSHAIQHDPRTAPLDHEALEQTRNQLEHTSKALALVQQQLAQANVDYQALYASLESEQQDHADTREAVQLLEEKNVSLMRNSDSGKWLA
jgi:chromosome segregation ATPase